jgi:hypothetical protein
MNTVGDLIGGLKVLQGEIALSLARGNAPAWETYHRMVGQYQGIQDALDLLDKLLKEDEDE